MAATQERMDALAVAPRRRSALPIVLLAVAIVAAAVIVPLLWPESSAADTRSMSFFEPETSGPTTQVDLGAKEFSAGDFILENHKVLDPRGGRERGTIVRQIQVVEVFPDGDFLFFVTAQIGLPGGTITYAGVTRYGDVAAGKGTVPITGGTGDYVGATGTVTGRLGKSGDASGVFLTVTMKLPS